MDNEQLKSEYFDWLASMVTSDDRYSDHQKLLEYLHSVEFRWLIFMDKNRAADGIDLREEFTDEYPTRLHDEILDILDGPCSVLEMMVALSKRIEETIMSSIELGDRTDLWFWSMCKNMDIYDQYDDVFDIGFVGDAVEKMIDRCYGSDGTGGLFVSKTHANMQKIEIWYQMCYWLNENFE